MSLSPLCFRSSAALAAIQAKMPVVMGQPIVALCFLARAARMSLIVMSFPVGTVLIISSTSIGAGITTVPVPQLFAHFIGDFLNFGKTFVVIQLFDPCCFLRWHKLTYCDNCKKFLINFSLGRQDHIIHVRFAN